jgi:hypothetical protein
VPKKPVTVACKITQITSGFALCLCALDQKGAKVLGQFYDAWEDTPGPKKNEPALMDMFTFGPAGRVEVSELYVCVDGKPPGMKSPPEKQTGKPVGQVIRQALGRKK